MMATTEHNKFIYNITTVLFLYLKLVLNIKIKLYF